MQYQGGLLQDLCLTNCGICCLCLNIQAVEQMQRKAARFVTSRYARDNSPTALVAKLGWLFLAHRQASARVLMMKPITNIDIPAAYYITAPTDPKKPDEAQSTTHPSRARQ